MRTLQPHLPIPVVDGLLTFLANFHRRRELLDRILDDERATAGWKTGS